MNLHVVAFTGEVYEVKMSTEPSTIRQVKAELGEIGFPWKLHLYPGVLEEDDDSKNVELDDRAMVHDGDILRSYVDSWKTWIVYPTTMNYLQQTSVEKFFNEVWACCLETGERQPLTELRFMIDHHYYMDLSRFLSMVSFGQPNRETMTTAIDSLLTVLLPRQYYGVMTEEMRAVYRPIE